MSSQEMSTFRHSCYFGSNVKTTQFIHLHRRRDWSKGRQRWGKHRSSFESKAVVWSETQGESRMRFQEFCGQVHMLWYTRRSQSRPSVCPLRCPTHGMCRLLSHSSSHASPKRTVSPTTTPRTRRCLGLASHTLCLLKKKEKKKLNICL